MYILPDIPRNGILVSWLSSLMSLCWGVVGPSGIFAAFTFELTSKKMLLYAPKKISDRCDSNTSVNLDGPLFQTTFVCVRYHWHSKIWPFTKTPCTLSPSWSPMAQERRGRFTDSFWWAFREFLFEMNFHIPCGKLQRLLPHDWMIEWLNLKVFEWYLKVFEREHIVTLYLPLEWLNLKVFVDGQSQNQQPTGRTSRHCFPHFSQRINMLRSSITIHFRL